MHTGCIPALPHSSLAMPVYSLLYFSTTTGWHGQALWQLCHVPMMPHGGVDTQVYTLFIPAMFQHCPLLVQDHLSNTVTWAYILICLLYHCASLLEDSCLHVYCVPAPLCGDTSTLVCTTAVCSISIGYYRHTSKACTCCVLELPHGDTGMLVTVSAV